MNQAEFDRFADEYQALVHRSIRASGEAPDFFVRYKVQDVCDLWQRSGHPEQHPTIIDFGCGVANSLPHFRRAFPKSRIVCLDVSRRSLEIAAGRFPAQAEFVGLTGDGLPLPSASVDIAFAACVFHHIDHDRHVPMLREFRRVLRPGGLACVFEHNPFNPLTRRAVTTCPFDVNARLISAGQMSQRFRAAGFTAPQVRYRIFFPGALRALRPLERLLTWCPLGAQYSVVGRLAREAAPTAKGTRQAA